MAFVSHRLGRTHYTRKGRNRKTPVVWLHGGPGGMHRTDARVFELAEDRQVYCYTQLGGGRSSRTGKKHWNIKTFVTELQLLVDAWGLDRFHLMGGSWGTTLALEYYLRRRGRGVASLVFQSPLFSSKDWKQDADRLIAKMPAGTRDVIETCHRIGATDAKVYADAMKEYYARHVLRNRTRAKQLGKTKNPNGREVYEHMWGPSECEPTGTLKNYNRVKDLSRIKVPSLIITGEFDEATPESGIRYANKIPGSSFSEIRGASHAIWEEKPARIRRVINEFLDQVETTEA